MGAFNGATEALSKGRAQEVTVEVQGRPELRLRLAKTAEHYAIEVSGAPAEAAEALRGLGLSAEGEAYVRAVRKAERSWDVASQLEDILQEALRLGPNVGISLTTQ
jgi:hypothetical protein